MILTLPLALCASESVRVELFLATECPISNRYVPELNRITTLYQPRGIAIEAFFPELDLDRKRLDRWARAYSAAFPVQLDNGAAIAAKAGATVTPQVVVFHKGKLVYRGRIDDRYVGWGKSRPSPTRRDLVEVLDQLLAGQALTPRFTKSWGCVIEAGSKR